MSKHITKEIPVSLHVKKYLEYTFGKQYTFSKNDFLGRIIFGVFQRGYRLREKVRLDTTYSIKLTEDNINRLGRHVKWEDCLSLDKGIDSVFRNQLHFLMNIHKKLGFESAKEAMLQGLYEIGITESDINFESLYRDYDRKKRYTKNKRSKPNSLKNRKPSSYDFFN
ncbi:hypothetical protein [Aquimarina algiphila]|uniref:Uncharacterized protein n=1 Tax=Aquimarina algiphila TaxID=2047982 RepID=A0A554VAT0_9FLAO|nr:hypothetical protein [Aquimarina algiphila]TSE03391.1 hypothetical protein FOF46_29430 [Aquimarina algiphila]